MRFARRVLLGVGLAAVLAVVAPLACAGQAAAPAAGSQASAVLTSAPDPYTLPPDLLSKAIALNRIRDLLTFADPLWDIAVLWLLLATRAAAGLSAWTERLVPRRWAQGLLFFAILIVALSLADLPLDMYAHHVSRSYGISVQGWGSWFVDMAKSLGLSVLIGAPVMLLFHWIVRRWPRRYWLAAWAVAVPLMVLSAFVEPLLEPIYNKYEPLEKSDPALVAQLEKVVARTGTDIPPSRMYLMKASVKTNGLNAYVSGIGATKRVVVWDTTAGRVPDDEILFIFAHESGHYVLHHIPKILTGSAVGLFFVFWACAGFAGWLARRCGVRWGLFGPEQFSEPQPLLATRAGFVVLVLTLTVAGFVMEPASNAFSRYFEHQADVYGQEAIHGIVPDPQKTTVAAFNALGRAWLDVPHPDPFIVFWSYSHPSTEERAEFAEHYDPWKDGGHGEFFKK